MAKPQEPRWEYRWFLRRVLPQRHGQLCRILEKPWRPGGSLFIIVEFPDGTQVSTTRVAVKRLRTARGSGRWSG